MSLPKTKSLIILLAVSLAIRLYMSIQIYSGDLNNHFKWGESIIDVGSRGVYDRFFPTVMKPTYPPLALYAFTTSSLAYRWVYSTASYLNIHISYFPSRLIWALQDQDVMPAFQKVIAILSDLGIGVLIYSTARYLKPKHHNLALLLSACYLLNPAVWYVSSIWGQIDSFPLFFILLGFYLILRNRSCLSVLAIAAALLSKQTSALFVPVFLIFWLSHFRVKQLIVPVLLSLLFFYLSYLPFAPSFNPIWPVQLYLDRLQTGSGSDYVTDHAFNFWALFTQLKKISDSTTAIFGFTYSQLGYLIFTSLALPTFISFLRQSNKTRALFDTLAIMSLAAFLFLPRMHERYLVPALPLLLLSSLYSRWLILPFIILSFGHLVNLYHNWWFPGVLNLQTLFSYWPVIQSIIFLFMLVLVILISTSRRYEK